MWKNLKTGRDRIGSLMLLMLLLGAYVPVGYMPADGAPFQVQLCPMAAGMPMPAPMAGMPAHHHHAKTHAADSCPFGSAPGAGPWSQSLVFQAPAPILSNPHPGTEFEPFGARPMRAHRSRAPPCFV